MVHAPDEEPNGDGGGAAGIVRRGAEILAQREVLVAFLRDAFETADA